MYALEVGTLDLEAVVNCVWLSLFHFCIPHLLFLNLEPVNAGDPFDDVESVLVGAHSHRVYFALFNVDEDLYSEHLYNRPVSLLRPSVDP